MKARDSIYAKRIYSLSQAFALRVCIHRAAPTVLMLKWSNTKGTNNSPPTHWPKFCARSAAAERVEMLYQICCKLLQRSAETWGF